MKIFTLLTLLAMLAACGSSPANYTLLEQARARYTAAQAEPQVASRAPEELSQAHQALIAAETAFEENESRGTVEHLAYLALQRVVVAQQTAAASVAEDVIASAAEEREQLQLAARTAEASIAERQLSLTQQQAARSEAERAAALAEAAATQSRLNQAQRNNAQTTAELAEAERREQASEARIENIEAQLRELNAQPSDRGMVVTLGGVLFEPGEATLLPAISSSITRVADFLKRNLEQRALIEGYTDNVGSAAANYELSQRRADAVRAELVRQGVESDRLTTRAFGADNPIASNGTPTGRQMNRRVEIIFTTP